MHVRYSLAPLAMVFSRDQAERFYVQHRLLQSADTLLRWLRDGAAIYVCGSLEGMAAGVDGALREILTEAGMAELSSTARYRRDVY